MNINLVMKDGFLGLQVNHNDKDHFFTPFDIFCIFKGTPGEILRLERALMRDKKVVGEDKIMAKLANKLEAHLNINKEKE